MSQDCAVNLDVITTIPKDCLRSRIAILSPKKMREVEEAVRFAMALE